MAALKYGLSLADYCKRRLGRSKYHVSEVLAGRRESPGLLDAVAADLGVDVVDITNEKNPTGSLWSA